jgi:hypothetical protein
MDPFGYQVANKINMGKHTVPVTCRKPQEHRPDYPKHAQFPKPNYRNIYMPA